MTFQRLRLADWVAWGAALVLIASLAFDWYGSAQGDQIRRDQGLLEESPRPEVRELAEEASFAAEDEERNAFQADALIDRVILVVLLGAAVLALVAAFGRAGARPRTPMAAAGVAAAVGTLLVAYRLAQEPGLDAATTIKFGALLGLLSAGVLALASRAAARAERDHEHDQDEPVAA